MFSQVSAFTFGFSSSSWGCYSVGKILIAIILAQSQFTWRRLGKTTWSDILVSRTAVFVARPATKLVVGKTGENRLPRPCHPFWRPKQKSRSVVSNASANDSWEQNQNSYKAVLSSNLGSFKINILINWLLFSGNFTHCYFPRWYFKSNNSFSVDFWFLTLEESESTWEDECPNALSQRET